LGFRAAHGESAGEVRSLWNGAAHVLLNGGSDLELRRATALPRPSVAALGIGVDDPTRLFARAEALMWEPSPRPAGGSAFTVTSPTGVAVQVGSAVFEVASGPDEVVVSGKA